MTVTTFKNWYLIHKWTSLICTIFLLLLCLTGFPLIFREELAVWLGEAVEVLAPDELRSRVSATARAQLRRYAMPAAGAV